MSEALVQLLPIFALHSHSKLTYPGTKLKLLPMSTAECIKFYIPQVWGERGAVMHKLSMAWVLGYRFMKMFMSSFLLMLNSIYTTSNWHWIIAELDQLYDLVDLPEPSLLWAAPDTYHLFHGQTLHLFLGSLTRVVFRCKILYGRWNELKLEPQEIILWFFHGHLP